MMSQTCLNFWGTRFGPWMDAHLKKNCDFARFSRKIKINRNLFRILRNFTDPLYIFFLEMSAKNQIKIQFLGRRFDVLVS